MERQMAEPHVKDADSRQRAHMSTIKRSATDIARAAILPPASLAEFGATLARGGPRRARRLLHAGTGILLGAPSLLAVGLEVFFVVRGVLYGVVDHGPYTHSWGGPTRAGAWLAHFGIGLLFAVAGLALLWFIAQLHHRLGARWLRGERIGAWVLPTALLTAAAGVLIAVAWLHQV
jgi:hypothetical protein